MSRGARRAPCRQMNVQLYTLEFSSPQRNLLSCFSATSHALSPSARPDAASSRKTFQTCTLSSSQKFCLPPRTEQWFYIQPVKTLPCIALVEQTCLWLGVHLGLLGKSGLSRYAILANGDVQAFAIQGLASALFAYLTHFIKHRYVVLLTL